MVMDCWEVSNHLDKFFPSKSQKQNVNTVGIFSDIVIFDPVFLLWSYNALLIKSYVLSRTKFAIQFLVAKHLFFTFYLLSDLVEKVTKDLI